MTSQPVSLPAPDLICVGECMALITPTDGALAEAHSATLGLAGAESNVAAQVAANGYRAVWASRVGDDPLGTRLLSELETRGVEAWAERDADAPTGVMFKDPGSESSDVYYYRRGSAASRMAAGFLSPAQLDGVRIVHTTGITPALSESCAEMTDQLFSDAHAAGVLVSFDVNDRRALWTLEEAASALAHYANAADLTFVGRDEAERLWATATAEDIRRHLPDCAVLIVKDGDVGATAFVGDAEPVFVPAPKVDVVEPVGAGDAFASGFLTATLQGLPYDERLSAGHAAAARVLVVPHDLPPLR